LFSSAPLVLSTTNKTKMVLCHLCIGTLLLQWDPPALEYVTKDMVDAYFAPLGEFDAELKLPTETREAFV